MSVRKPKKLIHRVNNNQTMPITCFTMGSCLKEEIINPPVDE